MRPYTSNRTRVSRLPLRTLAHSLNQTSFGASEIIRNVFRSCLLASTELRKTLLVSLSCGRQTCWKFACSLKVDHLVELHIYQSTCARACVHGAIRLEWVGKSNWATLLLWNKSNHWRGSSKTLFLRQALSNDVGYAWSVKEMCIPPYRSFPLQPLCGAISTLQCSSLLWWGNWSKLVSVSCQP